MLKRSPPPPTLAYDCDAGCPAIPKPVCAVVEGGSPSNDPVISFTLQNECIAYCQGLPTASTIPGACALDIDVNTNITLSSANFTTPREGGCLPCCGVQAAVMDNMARSGMHAAVPIGTCPYLRMCAHAPLHPAAVKVVNGTIINRFKDEEFFFVGFIAFGMPGPNDNPLPLVPNATVWR